MNEREREREINKERKKERKGVREQSKIGRRARRGH
jgi:hypothetical protein